MERETSNGHRWLATGTLFGLLLAASMPAAGAAQTVQGRMLDFATGEPVPSAAVRLVPAEDAGKPVATGITDHEGHFVLHAAAPGRYRLEVSRIGYEPVTTDSFDLLRGEVPLEVEVRLSAVAVVLAPVTIVSERAPLAESQRLQTVGFYDRKKRYGPEGLGLGEFFDQEEIRQTNPSRVSDVLRMVRGVRVAGAGGTRQVIQLRGQAHYRHDGRCTPQVYVDLAPAATGRNIDDLISPWSLVAIEVYPGLSVPAEFSWYVRSRTEEGIRELRACGVIALWTGYGGPGAAPAPRDEPVPKAFAAASEPSTPFALHLTLSADSVTLRDSLLATLTIANMSDDSVSLCLTDSRYSLRGPHTTKDVVERTQYGSCVHIVDLPPGGSHSWQELLALFSVMERPDEVLIQKYFRVRVLTCVGGEECETQLRSEPRHFVLHSADGEY